MAALSLTPSRLAQISSQRHRRLNSFSPKSTRRYQISAAKIPFSSPPSPPPGGLYQPFRPPPSPIPAKYRSLDPAERLEVLRDRLGAWYEYASLIPALSNDGFTPTTIEELTGISGVEQNSLVVSSRVRDSLVSSNVDPDILAYFDSGGYDLLYELRLLSNDQRVAAVIRVVEERLDSKGAQELARAMKDFPRRKGDPGWASFSRDSPGDCLAFSYFRQSGEAIADSDRIAALEKALAAVETETARNRLVEEMEKKSRGESGDEADEVAGTIVPVVRMRYGEVAEATSVVVLPVADSAAGEEELAAAPASKAEGEFGVVTAEKPWRKWVVLPRWDPLTTIGVGGGVAVGFPDARLLPWKTARSAMEESVLVVVDRTRKEVKEDGFYLLSDGSGKLAVERGKKLLEAEGETVVLGALVIVARPPVDDSDDQILDEEWD